MIGHTRKAAYLYIVSFLYGKWKQGFGIKVLAPLEVRTKDAADAFGVLLLTGLAKTLTIYV